MFLYNITFGVDKEIEQTWLQWIMDKHIPDVMRTGFFKHNRIYKILHDEDEGTVSYSVQYFAESIEDVRLYLEKFGPALIEEHRRKFIDRHVAFQTLLEEVG